MKNACELLELGTYRISEVAYMVGFQDEKYFGKCFNKYAKMSPKEYVKAIRENKKVEEEH